MLYEYDPVKNALLRKSKNVLLSEKILKTHGIKNIGSELEKRRKYLESLQKEKCFDLEEVVNKISQYHQRG